MPATFASVSTDQFYRRSQSSVHAPGSRRVETPATAQQYLVVFAANASGSLKLDGRKYDLDQGQFVLVNPGKDVAVQIHQPLMIAIDASALDQWRKEIGTTQPQKVFPHTHGRFEVCEQIYHAEDSLLGQALLEASRGTNAASFRWEELVVRHQWTIYQQLQRLTSAKLSTRKELYRRLCKARRFIMHHLDAPLDLDTLSQVACLSKYHFIRLFKEVYGQTPRQYLIARRLERASVLLRESDLSFHEICQEVGLKDSSSFGRLFKRSFGFTPHLYRRMHAAS